MKIKLLLCLTLLSFTVQSATCKEAIAAVKWSSVCLILQKQLNIAHKTKNKVATQFIKDFVHSESVRLGISYQSYWYICKLRDTEYNNFVRGGSKITK